MGKIGEKTKCPKCDEPAFTLGIERGPDPEQVKPGAENPDLVPLRKRWKCDSCGYESEESFPGGTDFFGGEVFPEQPKKE